MLAKIRPHHLERKQIMANEMEKKEKDNSKFVVNTNPAVWLKAIIGFNIVTTIAALTVVTFSAMISNVSDNYDTILDSVEKTEKKMDKLKENFSNNARITHELYVADSTKKEKLKRNSKQIINTPTAIDTPLYVKSTQKYHPEPSK